MKKEILILTLLSLLFTSSLYAQEDYFEGRTIGTSNDNKNFIFKVKPQSSQKYPWLPYLIIDFNHNFNFEGVDKLYEVAFRKKKFVLICRTGRTGNKVMREEALLTTNGVVTYNEPSEEFIITIPVSELTNDNKIISFAHGYQNDFTFTNTYPSEKIHYSEIGATYNLNIHDKSCQIDGPAIKRTNAFASKLLSMTIDRSTTTSSSSSSSQGSSKSNCILYTQPDKLGNNDLRYNLFTNNNTHETITIAPQNDGTYQETWSPNGKKFDSHWEAAKYYMKTRHGSECPNYQLIEDQYED